MREIHSFGSFVPMNAKYLILGSFPGKVEDGYGWFYGNRRNQFWPILMEVYEKDLSSTAKQKRFFRQMGIAITDVILSCERVDNSNLDVKLKNLVYNSEKVEGILKKNSIEKIFLTSRFVENIYRRKFRDLVEEFPGVSIVTLPSPSPRYAMITRAEKVRRYRELLPVL